MGSYQHKDRYYQKAKERGLPSRASFKIEEILEKFPIVKPGDTVLDLGAAPGGWSVILAKAVGPRGRVLAMDLQKLQKAHAPNILFLQEDIKSEAARRWVEETLKGEKFACLCSDMSPKLSGIAFKDAYLSYELGLLSLEYARTYLREKGNLVIKFFPGEEFPDFLKILRGQFGKVKVFEPASSRKTSREVYILAMGYRRKAQPPLGSGVGVGVGTT